MEIYADESNDRVFVGDGRGPYTVVERDGSTSESFIPRNAKAVYSDAGPHGWAGNSTPSGDTWPCGSPVDITRWP
jgi:hypothetical protein